MLAIIGRPPTLKEIEALYARFAELAMSGLPVTATLANPMRLSEEQQIILQTISKIYPPLTVAA